MWAVNALEFRRFQSQAVPFTELVDALISAEMALAGAPHADLATNLRVTIQDGGVDTRLSVAMPASATGWFEHPTCWQYKARPYKDIKTSELKKEIFKEHAKTLINQGYAYRLCIADSLPDAVREQWEEVLTSAANKIDPSAQPPRVVTAEHLGQWISGLPALVARFCRPELFGFFDLISWQPNASQATRTYLPVKEWSNAKQLLEKHIDLARGVPDPVLRLQGEAGVGKTRFVYETINNIPGTRLLTLYTADDQNALKIAPMLAKYRESTAILVVDDCPLETSVKLSELLRGFTGRIRVVVIDNSGTHDTAIAPELRLERIPSETVNEILLKNFPAVPLERRVLYGELSGGFIRLAAELCKSDAQIAQAGDLRGTLPNVRAYLKSRLGTEDLRVLQAVSLVLKVGFRDEIAQEMDDLCSLLNLNREELVNRAKRLKDAPGFITQGGRYFYVTPEMVAQVAFQDGWKRWVEDDPQAFLARLPERLLQSFHHRVMKSAANDNIRRTVADFFRAWAKTLKAGDLVHHKTLDRLLALGETKPEGYLPLISGLISDSSLDELRAIDTRSSDDDAWRWGPRRYLVWFLERIASFAEYFAEAELALFKLAQAETEPDISNNATGIWKGLFCIFAGTAAPYPKRLDILKARLLSPVDSGDLGIAALQAALKSFDGGTRALGPKIFAGRVVPSFWNPRTNQEARDCFDKTVDLLVQLSVTGKRQLEEGAENIAHRNLRGLLYRGELDALAKILMPSRLSASLLPRVLEQIEDFLRYDRKRVESLNSSTEEYVSRILAWKESLVPANAHGRIISLVGKSPWHERNRQEESQWKQELMDLAGVLDGDPNQLKAELTWLCSPDAKSAGHLGVEIGRLDRDVRSLRLVAQAAAESSNYAFALGYLAGLLERYPEEIIAVNRLLDEMEPVYPRAVFELSSAGGRKSMALERALRLVDTGTLEAFRLATLSRGPQEKLSDSELQEILPRLLKAIEASDHEASKAAVDLLGCLVRSEPPSFPADIRSGRTIELAWEVIDRTTRDEWVEPYWWTRVLEALSKIDPNRGAKIGGLALTGSFFISDEAEKVLIRIAAFAPKEVMLALGETMLDENLGPHFFLGVHRELLAALPADVVQDWLESTGAEGARHIARHLPEPFVDSNGTPTVPALTEFVLSKFEGDDRTFQEFYAGTHSHKSYLGDIASQVESEGLAARKFLNHHLRRIKEWARLETQTAAKEAEMWRRLDEEQKIR